MSSLVEQLQGRFPQASLVSREDGQDLTITIKKDSLLEACRSLRDELGFTLIVDICSVDWLGQAERFEVVYHVYSLGGRQRLRLKTRVTEDDPVLDSVTAIWPGANFMEREVYDMMGIRFHGHPDLRRIMMTEDFEGWPLRKDFPTEGKGWRHNFPFMPGPEE